MAKTYKTSILSVYDNSGNKIEIPAIEGKSAYAYAVEAGYKGTEAEFAENLNKNVPTKTSELTNDSGYITNAPVTSVNSKTGAVTLSASDVGADSEGTASTAVSSHNTNTNSHNDIRVLINTLTTKVNNFLDVDDTTTDQLSELIALIQDNASDIESITNGKVNVSDIVNNLTTNVSNKPLSAAQGVALKALIDAITVPTKTSQLTNDSGFLTQHQSLSGYAKTADHYTKTESDTKYQAKGNYLTSVPSEYVTDSELNAKGYLTQHQDLSSYAKKSEIPTVPTKVSAFTNDKGYLTNADLSLGIASDGLIYLFIDGQPVGTGIPQGQSGDVFGYIDENNTIVLNGNLADGTYYVKYETDDGDVINIGELSFAFSVTKSLTYCTISNSATSVARGSSYSATITANSGYVLKSVSVTMGGTAVSVSGGVINIASVTGDIVITAVAEVGLVNQIPLSIGTNGTAFGTNGIMEGYRWSSSGTTFGNTSGACTGLIAVTAGDTVYLKDVGLYNIYIDAEPQRVTLFNSSKSHVAYWQPYKTDNTSVATSYTKDSTGQITSFVVAASGYIAISAFNSSGASKAGVSKYLNTNSIITINQPIS